MPHGLLGSGALRVDIEQATVGRNTSLVTWLVVKHPKRPLDLCRGKLILKPDATATPGKALQAPIAQGPDVTPRRERPYHDCHHDNC